MKKQLLLALLAALPLAATAHAVDGENLIAHAKALAGNVTPGDAPGYPVTLSLSGRYKPGGKLVQPEANTKVIEATATNIDFDLNGFNRRTWIVVVNDNAGAIRNNTITYTKI